MEYRVVRRLGDPVAFGEPDVLLLELAQNRWQQEQALNSTIQAKTGLFLTFAGFFSALLAQPLLKIVEQFPDDGGPLEVAAGTSLVLALGLLLHVIFTLLKATITPGYSDLSGPAGWIAHVRETRLALDSSPNKDELLFDKLRWDLLDAWAEAADKDSKANRDKAELLNAASRSLRWVVVAAAAGILLFMVQGVARPKKPAPGTKEDVLMHGDRTVPATTPRGERTSPLQPPTTPSESPALPARPANSPASRAPTSLPEPERPIDIQRR